MIKHPFSFIILVEITAFPEHVDDLGFEKRVEELCLTIVSIVSGVIDVFKIINCVLFKILQWITCYVSVNTCCLSIHWFCSVPSNGIETTGCRYYPHLMVFDLAPSTFRKNKISCLVGLLQLCTYTGSPNLLKP